MQHELQVRILKELFAQLDAGKNIDAGVQYKMPTSAYVCPEMAASEWRTLFQNHPQFIGLSGDLPGPDTFFTLDEFGTPVLATRDSDGVFHAFVNACRHRGVKVANDTSGKKKRFTCPFHAWTYSSQGELVAIPREEDFGVVDKTCNSLIALPCAERDGMLWVHPQPGATLDLDELLGELSDELASLNLARHSYAGGRDIDMPLNWKLANDTFGETYHFQKLHKDTLGQIFYGNNLSYEEFGRHHRFVTASKNIDAMRDKPESEWHLTDGAFIIYYLFPNIQLLINFGRVTLVRIYPDERNAGHSVTRIRSYFDNKVEEKMQEQQSDSSACVTAENVYDSCRPVGSVVSLEAMMEVFYSTVEKEDYAMGAAQQKTAQSGVLEHIIFGRNEPPLHHFHNSFRDALGLEPLEEVAG
ncbi:MAG: aromatic ring-hydroxylating dioxygenase subunit alpha [Pseudomonadales bacterium]|nr:aromatic ring-hydroxylating dioxygenase subunit alpha [Pseudomonadales bacterium]